MLKKSILSLSLIGLISAANASGLDCSQVTEIPSTECEALVALYNSTNGDNWYDNSGWLETNTPCSWEGVICSGGHVFGLYLYQNRLTGSIPPELGNLSGLEYLYLESNSLTGSIPSELGNLSNLRSLHLGHNSLTGSIPPELGNLSNLEYLNLYSNSLTSSIPPELGNLSNLEYLYLGSNSLTGSIPPELGNLSNLTMFVLAMNLLTGSIPPELGNLSNLQGLYLYENSLTGSIPPELGNLSNLTGLYLYENSLTGAIPPELGNLSKLKTLHMNDNQLCGEIPVELKNLSNIYISNFKLDNNHLTASDSELVAWLDSHNPGWNETQTPCSQQQCKLQLSSATYSLAENGGQATITVTRTGNSDGAVSIDYATSDYTATAPDDYTHTSGTLNWNDGDDADKTFTIAITDDSQAESDETFTVSLGNPTGGAQLEIPDTAVVTITDNDSTFSCRKVTDISRRECNALVALYNSTNGNDWLNNAGWKVTNEPCNWYGVTCKSHSVNKLELSSNNLKGSPSIKLLKLSKLKTLDLNDNCLNTEIDAELKKWLDALNPGWDETQTACFE
ncbi:MAG: leucine-rich repeat domain-containing protein [Pseudomonadota bacterium]